MPHWIEVPIESLAGVPAFPEPPPWHPCSEPTCASTVRILLTIGPTRSVYKCPAGHLTDSSKHCQICGTRSERKINGFAICDEHAKDYRG